uniref:Uncharacterized protein n=1 Tax=Alexandrium andersonii TaxID=327968 RepID=A0A7S2HIR9_9DINO|mmetsp:Transcript_71905/g.160991  ORF Transcript_71905/g.160991 Transcript_71905/m.160991 type:complete len:125 (+) Transcript_71905:76-450(+)
MTTRTPAVPDDFPHFAAWYGQVPGFEHARVRHKDFNCKDQVFHLRQLVDARYYLHWHYSDAGTYGTRAYFKAMEDWLRCRRIRKMEPADRPRALREWFLEKHQVNLIWEYRTPPPSIGKHEELM